jgi:hypothetical protein
VTAGSGVRYFGPMRWSVLLLLVGCGSPQVKDIVFPAVAIDADGSVRGYMSVRSLTTTNRQAIERYPGRRVIDASGREYSIEAVREVDPPGMFRDFAGTQAFRVELTLARRRRMAPSAAVALIADAVRAKPDHLDLTEQGGGAVADEIASKTTVAEVAELLAVKYEPRKVVAEASARENRRVEELARRGE